VGRGEPSTTPAGEEAPIHDREDGELSRRFEESARRSRARRQARRRTRARRRLRRRDRARAPAGRRRQGGGWILGLGAGVGIAAVAAAAILAGAWLIDTAGDRDLDLLPVGGSSDSVATEPEEPAEPRPYPRRAAIDAARAYANGRDGLVSFAVVDTLGGTHGFDDARTYVSASVVKAMLLAAELDRLAAEGLPLDSVTRDTLHAMITYSDNVAADTIYYRVGDEGLFEVARRAGMRDFTVAGYWANAQLSARDMARFMDRLNEVLTGPHADFAAGLLAAIIPEQRWGIPEATPEGWRIRFKGGWRGTELGQLVHQIARLERGRRDLALAVLTDGQPTMDYGIETVRGIAERLLSHPPDDLARSQQPGG
jgi:Beta-lactamase enzyme family